MMNEYKKTPVFGSGVEDRGFYIIKPAKPLGLKKPTGR
jgi:hypothetical protein